MKEIKLFVDFEFTSLSPDAQPISVGIVSEDFPMDVMNAPTLIVPSNKDKKAFFQANNKAKSFYAEFSDFDINRCDDWVKENVVGKLKHFYDSGRGEYVSPKDKTYIEQYGPTAYIKEKLKEWLKQFSDYQITFIVDCGTWDWYHLLQLIGKWEEAKEPEQIECHECSHISFKWIRTGLPILPSNISPVPMDLNDLIAHKKGISVREAFELNREVLAFGRPDLAEHEKHFALCDAKVMKAIYEKLTV